MTRVRLLHRLTSPAGLPFRETAIMQPAAIADVALRTLRKELDAAKFTPEEWADVELAVGELTLLTTLIAAADKSQLPGIERRLRLARSVLANYSLAKSIEAEGAVARAVEAAFTQALGVGLATLKKVLVA